MGSSIQRLVQASARVQVLTGMPTPINPAIHLELRGSSIGVRSCVAAPAGAEVALWQPKASPDADDRVGRAEPAFSEAA